MADRYLLESGAPDGYQLEDGSGVLLLEVPPVNEGLPARTVGPGLPFQASPRGFAAQAAGSNLSLDIDSPGTITVAGQTVTFTVNSPVSTQGSITLAGQTVTFTLAAPISTQGSIDISGQSTTFSLNEPVTNGSITIDGQSVSFALNEPVTNGSIDINGQTVTFTLGVPVSTQGSVTIDGQSITLDLPIVQTYAGFVNRNVGPALPFQTSPRDNYRAPATNLSLDISSPGAITIDGQSLTLSLPPPNIGLVRQMFGPAFAFTSGPRGLTAPVASALSIENGSISVTGQSVTFSLNEPLSNGSITITGQDLTLATSIVGSLNKTLGILTLSSTGQEVVRGALDKTLGVLLLTSAGQILVKGTLNKTLGLLTLYSTNATSSGTTAHANIGIFIRYKKRRK